jgi:putative hydrolase of the HAD superfamily
VQQVKIKACGLDKYIVNMYLSDQIGYHKPDRRIFEYAVKSSNARKKESLMIGDNFQADIIGAKNFGIDQMYFTNSIERKPLLFEPTYVVSSLKEIMNIL